jgi:hypothetical protein
LGWEAGKGRYPLQPWALNDETLVELARLRGRVHDAGAGFDCPDAACDSDLEPHNTADEEGRLIPFEEVRLIPFIDWVLEHAAELAQ